MAKPAPLPDLTLSEQELMGTYSEFMPVVMDMLQSFHPAKPITGEDLYSFFGLCVGALIDNDSHLTTPGNIRLGAETSAVHAIGWAKRFREMRGDDGPPSSIMLWRKPARRPSRTFTDQTVTTTIEPSAVRPPHPVLTRA